MVIVQDAFENNSNQNNLMVYPVTRSISFVGGENLARVGECNAEYDNGATRRFRAELWITNTPPVYSGTGARAKHQRRRLGIWWANSADEITLDLNGTFSQTGPGPGTVSEAIDFTDHEFNTANIQWSWQECFNVACTFDASARVEVIGKNGPFTRNCVIQ